MAKVQFHCSIRGQHFPIPAYAVMRDLGDNEMVAVQRCLERASGCGVMLRPAGYEIDSYFNNRVTATIYQGTVVKRKKIAGAYPVVAELTVKIKPVRNQRLDARIHID